MDFFFLVYQLRALPTIAVCYAVHSLCQLDAAGFPFFPFIFFFPLQERELPYEAAVLQYPIATSLLSGEDFDALDELLLRVEAEPNVTAVTTTAERQEA